VRQMTLLHSRAEQLCMNCPFGNRIFCLGCLGSWSWTAWAGTNAHTRDADTVRWRLNPNCLGYLASKIPVNSL